MRDATQYRCKCDNEKFRLIAELHSDSLGSFNPADGWQFECTKCGTIYDKSGKEITPEHKGGVKKKCICGYEEEHVLGSTMKEAEPFKRVYISVHESQYHGVPVVDNFTVKMFACPKCGTVNIQSK